MTSKSLGQDIAVTLADIEAARERLRNLLPCTPLMSSETLSRMTNTALWLKPENLQKTGSYKVHGALNAVIQLPDEARQRGVVTFSAGNHGQSLAYAAARAGVPCTVFMASNAVPSKVEAIHGYGARTRMYPTIQEAFSAMERVQREQGAIFVSPFADPPVIAGQGVVGLEILEQLPEVEQIVVPVGGGGLIAGVALAVKALRPEVRIVGVEPEGAATLHRALEAGESVRLDAIETIADGLGAPFTHPRNLAIVQEHVDDMVLVNDTEITTALHLVLERCKLLAEPAGAAAVAALLTGKAAVSHGARTIAIISGGNIDLGRLKTLL